MDLAGARWRKSTRTATNGTNGDCVEVALIDDSAAVRDTKNRTGPTLIIPQTSFSALLRGL